MKGELTQVLKEVKQTDKRSIQFVETLTSEPDNRTPTTNMTPQNKFVIRKGKYLIKARITSSYNLPIKGIKVNFFTLNTRFVVLPSEKGSDEENVFAFTDESGVASASLNAYLETPQVFLKATTENADPVHCEIEIIS